MNAKTASLFFFWVKDCHLNQRNQLKNKPFLFNEVNSFNQEVAITLNHDKHIQHVLLLDHMLNLQTIRTNSPINTKSMRKKICDELVKRNSILLEEELGHGDRAGGAGAHRSGIG